MEAAGPEGPIPVRIYRPSEEKDLPALVYFHGGGWVIGDLDWNDGICRQLCDDRVYCYIGELSTCS